MTDKLSDLFRATSGRPIEWQGKLVQMMFEFTANTGNTLRLRFGSVSPARPQALRLKARGGRLVVNGQGLGDVILWSDSSPSAIDIQIDAKTKSEVAIRAWNAWRDESGATQAWIGNSGMIVAQDERQVTLHCSDGFDEPTFDDLVVMLEIERNP